MSYLPELSKKEPSTKALLEKSKSRDDDIAEGIASPESRLAEGMHYDKNKTPAIRDRDKARTEKVEVEGGASARVIDKTRRNNPAGVA